MIQDTICAIATAQGGAIGSIRVSGPEAISITAASSSQPKLAIIERTKTIYFDIRAYL